jgi:hypothetical protein
VLPENFWGEKKKIALWGKVLLNLIEDVCFELLLKMYKYFQSLDTPIVKHFLALSFGLYMG